MYCSPEFAWLCVVPMLPTLERGNRHVDIWNLVWDIGLQLFFKIREISGKLVMWAIGIHGVDLFRAGSMK